MANEYTPTTEEVRAVYVAGTPPHMVTVTDGNAEFDRWLAAHDRAVKAEALREAAEGYKRVGNMHARGWLLDRADQIEGDSE